MSGIFEEELLKLRDEEYCSFQSKLIPNVNREKIIGVRMPELRSFAKKIKGSREEAEFLLSLPHKYYDEDNLHGILISMEKDFRTAIDLLEVFLPYVDNWASCDIISPASFFKNKKEVIFKSLQWIRSKNTYTVRFAIVMLMKHGLEEEFDKSHMQAVADIKSDEYYINMARAWYFATALSKQYDSSVIFLEKRMLDEWTHRKTVRKAIESYMIDDERKKYLKTLVYNK